MGTMAAFVFAAQMVNFPVGPLPISGHLIGGVLAAVMLGPWAGAGVIAAVLIVQCLLFADGGPRALGANFVNMGLIGSVVGYAIYAPIRRAIGGRSGVLVGGMVASWFSVLLAASAFAVELAASGRRADFLRVLGWMILIHAAIGLGEAIITGLVLRAVLLRRPDLVHDSELAAGPIRWGQVTACGLAVALALAAFLAPFASEHPDGLEWVGARLGFNGVDAPDPPFAGPVADYQLAPGFFGEGLATALAGLIGTAVVFGVGLAMARAFARNGPGLGTAPDAA